MEVRRARSHRKPARGSSKFLVVIVTTMVDMVTPEMEVTMLKATITTTVDMVVDMMTLPSPARDHMVTVVVVVVVVAAALAILLTKKKYCPEEEAGDLAKSWMEAGDMMMLVMMPSTNTGPNNFISVERTEEGVGMGMVLILFPSMIRILILDEKEWVDPK